MLISRLEAFPDKGSKLKGNIAEAKLRIVLPVLLVYCKICNALSRLNVERCHNCMLLLFCTYGRDRNIAAFYFFQNILEELK